MAFSAALKTYADIVGIESNNELNKILACGLPKYWGYMKLRDQEANYFELLKKTETNSSVLKDFFYAIMFINSSDNFSPKVPTNLLKIHIPSDVLAADIHLAPAEIDVGCSFSREELAATLQKICIPHRVVHIGTKVGAVAMVLSNNKYFIYHTGNSEALEFKAVNECVDVIMRALNSERLHITTSALEGVKKSPELARVQENLLLKALRQEHSHKLTPNKLLFTSPPKKPS